MDEGDVLLEFVNVRKSFKKKEVLRGVSFGIPFGSIFGLVGASGSGKTTILKILMGMIEPDSGSLSFDRVDAIKNMKYLRKNAGFASQDNMLFGELSIKENCFYFGRLYGLRIKEIRENFAQLIPLMGLEGFEKTQVKYLSGGMSKRANILVSLIHKPKLLILDEPTAGLDPSLRKSIWDYIHTINQTGTTVLVTTHLLDEIEEHCRAVAVLNLGRIVRRSTVDQMKKEFGKDKSFTQIFMELMKL